MAYIDIVSALCDAIVTARCEGAAHRLSARRDEIVRFVVAQQGRMPDYLRGQFLLAAMAFDWLGVLRTGCPFHRQSAAARWRQVESWRDGPLSVTRDFVRFYESPILYRWYADDER